LVPKKKKKRTFEFFLNNGFLFLWLRPFSNGLENAVLGKVSGTKALDFGLSCLEWFWEALF
jgi:hypothetical protein